MGDEFTKEPNTDSADRMEAENQEGVSGNEAGQEQPLDSTGEDLAKLKQEYDSKFSTLSQKLAQRERELQSESDRRISAVQNKYQQEIEAMENQMNELMLANLDENERTKYQQSVVSRKISRAEQRAAEAEEKLRSMQMMQDNINGFTALGVPLDKLDRSSPDNLFRSGWQAVQEELATLRAGAAAAPAASTPAATQEAKKPESKPVPKRTIGEAGARGSAPAPPSFAQVKESVGKQLGRDLSDEDFYRLVETGQVPPSILPGLVTE